MASRWFRDEGEARLPELSRSVTRRMDMRRLVALTTNSLAQAVGVGSDQPEGATEPAGAPTGRGTLAGAGRVAWGACWALLGPWMAERDCARHHATVGRARRMCWAMLQNFLLELAKPRG